MPTASEHHLYIAEQLSDVGSPARFEFSMAVMRNRNDLNVEPEAAIADKAADQALLIGGEEVALGTDATATIKKSCTAFGGSAVLDGRGVHLSA